MYNSSEDKVSAEISIESKGVGPAILGDVTNLLDGHEVESYTVVDKLKELYPDFDIVYTHNEQINDLVISAGEKITIIGFYINGINTKNTEILNLLNTLEADLQFCYCSIYKECWKFDMSQQEEYDPCD